MPTSPSDASADSTAATVSHEVGRRKPSPFTLALALAGVLLVWSLNYIVCKITLARIEGLTLAALRAEVVAVILLAVYAAQRTRTPLRTRDIWTITYLGFFGYVVNQGFFVVGLSHTTSDHSVIIIASAPIVVLLVASAMRLEKLTAAKAVGMAICFVGVVLLETEHGLPTRSPLLVGDLISLGGVIGFSAYAVLGKKVARAYDTISMNTFNSVAAAILLLPLAVRQGIRLDWKSVGWIGWTGLLYMAALSAVVGYLLFYWLLGHMDASRVVAVNYFQPVVVVLISIPLLDERPTGRLVASAALVLMGVYLAERVSS
jgi:drug/metabolite transporter (DMT)-like permease